jgi:hypothetical protein
LAATQPALQFVHPAAYAVPHCCVDPAHLTLHPLMLLVLLLPSLLCLSWSWCRMLTSNVNNLVIAFFCYCCCCCCFDCLDCCSRAGADAVCRLLHRQA